MKKFSILFVFFLLSCANNSASDLMADADTFETLNLKWNKAYPDDNIQKSSIGLEWALSYCGAILPNAPGGINVGTEIITLNLSELGFTDAALEKLYKLHQKIKSSPEYQANGTIDLGRYVTLLLGAPEHYYRIVGIPEKLDDVLSNYNLLPEKGYVNHSGVSLEHRILRFSEQKKLNQVFVSSEVDSVSGAVYEYETIEIIPNGQIRFGIFDADGNRKNNADALHSNAGKPAKCMWCHESIIQPLYNVQGNFPEFLTYLQLKEKLINFNQLLQNQKYALTTGVDFSQNQQNTLTELLYISFMEPSAERLALEWNLPLANVQSLLLGLPTHTYHEFPFLGNLYDRNMIENLAPHKGLSVSSSVREASETEVNHIN
ncbi:hypothetical protein FNO01nite_03280 [Flavobacterium noncentrifugens]|uniref:Uncharacterized protein n=1 Tax=Flavobacterium noncentrifugens TaxID=1128970 RepID=A0A1G8S101_9FLAO|nr:hypothetical protein [Flavobacterium noncentrifugens]GEP49656.1 hypothetical protein FNO01nite_03280 [Flavobacterium noncentrifugens]SDJ22822.1 hypothetical protein SAMN04487935_0363 [Flavobacterium noncentrifugens]